MSVTLTTPDAMVHRFPVFTSPAYAALVHNCLVGPYLVRLRHGANATQYRSFFDIRIEYSSDSTVLLLPVAQSIWTSVSLEPDDAPPSMACAQALSLAAAG